MPLLLKNYSIAKLTYLGIRLNEIKSSLGNEKKNNGNGVNNQNTHTHTHTHTHTYRGKNNIRKD